MGVASLHFVGGTLELRGVGSELGGLPSDCAWDPRSACFRAPASHYAPLVLSLKALGLSVDDSARAYAELDFGLRAHKEPRPFQSEALAQAGLALEKTDRSAAVTYFEKLITKDELYPLAAVLKERVGK